MNVLRVALGVIQKRGATVVDPGLVTFGPDEADFLARHVTRVRTLTDSSPRALFSTGSGVPALLAGLPAANDAECEATSKVLQDRLVATMRGTSQASDCVLAVLVTQEHQRQEVTILKLDAVIEAARMEFLKSGRVSLKVLKELLPEPGRLQKSVSWPDPRGVSDAITIDTNVTAARYFENAYDLQVSPKSTEAEAELGRLLVERLPAARLREAYERASGLSGPLDEVLTDLAGRGFPELEEPAQQAASDRRPSGIIRPNKVAVKPVVWRADGIEVRVPPNLADSIEITETNEGWQILVPTKTRPAAGT